MAPGRIFWAVLQAEMHFEAMLTWGFIDATVNLSVQTTQNPELMAIIGPKTCKTAQNYMSEVDSKMPARARAFRFANPWSASWGNRYAPSRIALSFSKTSGLIRSPSVRLSATFGVSSRCTSS